MSYEGKNLETIALHAGWRADETTGSVAVPIHQTTSYLFESTEKAANLFALAELGNIYTRIMNPTNAVLEESDIVSNNNHAYPLTARAFLDLGQQVSKEDIKAGDIVVFPRGDQGWQGHVGFYLKTQIVNGVEYYLILGGNQRNKVSIVTYRSSRALGIRREATI